MKIPTKVDYKNMTENITEAVLYNTNVGVQCSAHCKPAACKACESDIKTYEKLDIKEIRK